MKSKVCGLNAPEVKQFQEMLEVPEGDYDGKFQRVGWLKWLEWENIRVAISKEGKAFVY